MKAIFPREIFLILSKCSLIYLILLLSLPMMNYAQRIATLGELDCFRNGIANSVRSIRLSDDKVLIAYRNGTSSSASDLILLVGTVSGSNITYGPEVRVTDSIMMLPELIALSPSKAVIFYEHNSSPDILKSHVVEIHGNLISINKSQIVGIGTERSYQASMRATALNQESIVICYEANLTTDSLWVIAGNVKETNIEWGRRVCVAANVTYCDVCRVTNSKFALAYEYNDGANGSEGMIVAGTIVENEINLGISQSFESSRAVGSLALTALDKESIVVAYEDDGSSSPVDPGKVFLAELNETNFTFPGNRTSFYHDGDPIKSISELEIDALSSNEIIIVVNGGAGDYGVVYSGVLSSNNIQLSPYIKIREGEIDDPNINALTSDIAVVNYIDDDNLSGVESRGESRVLTFEASSNPEINVQSNNMNIELGENTPTVDQYTDFQRGSNLSKSFSIQNKGAGTLYLGENSVSISGPDASFFSVQTQPLIELSGNSSTSFIIGFSSVDTANHIALVNVSSSDIHEPNYFFAIQAKGATVCTWNGSSNSDWATTSNWEEGKIPSSISDVNIPNSGIEHYPVIAPSTNADCNNLDIYSGALLTLKSEADHTASLIVDGSFSGKVCVERYLSENSVGWHLFGVSVSGQGINDFLANSNNSIDKNEEKYGLGVYNEDDDSWITFTDISANAAGNLIQGKAYEFKRNSDGIVRTVGSLSDSDINIVGSRQGSGWNLIGNPFPCALNANAYANEISNFLSINSESLDEAYKAIYIWNPLSNSYEAINQSSGISYISSGQGFFVKLNEDGAMIHFTKEMRTHQTNCIFKNIQNSYPELVIKSSHKNASCNTRIKYIDETSYGLDPGYDAGLFEGLSTELYMGSKLIEAYPGLFEIQCLPPNKFESQIIPIEIFSRESCELNFTIEKFNFSPELKLFLEDKENDRYYQLKENRNTPLIKIPEGQQSNRFFIHIRRNDFMEVIDSKDPMITLIPDYVQEKILIKGMITSNEMIKIFDLRGHLVLETVLTNQNLLNVSGLKSGMYIISIIKHNKTINLKLVWLNKN